MSDAPKVGDVVVMVGTKKGGFLFWSAPARKDWRRSLHHKGWMVHHMAHDPRDNSIYAATNSGTLDGVVQRTPDFGATWERRSEKLDFPAESEHRVRRVWHLAPKPNSSPGHMYAGVERAGLFATDDFGATWKGVEGLNSHEHSKDWQPGGGGLMVHTVLVDPHDPNRIYVAISAAGTYRSDDGGKSWSAKNKNVRADFMPEKYPVFGQCVHKLALHPAKSNVLYQQNHCGVYRSENRGDDWTEITEGLPSQFGFPFAIHAHDPDTIYVVPLTDDGNRVVPEDRMTVWRSRNRGDRWEPLTKGLPDNAHLTILREAMAVDSADQCGVYVGTETGQLFFSPNEGEHWQLMADLLPPIYSVSTGRVA